MVGVYKIINKINNKVYIGSSVDIKGRWRGHKSDLKLKKHQNSHLQRSWNKYGADAFEFSIIIICEKDNLKELERQYILEHDAFNWGYNVNDPNDGFLNKKHTDETKKKLSDQKLGDKNPMYGMTGEKHPNFNKKVSEESKLKMSLSHKGIPTNRRNYVKLKEEDILIIRKLKSEKHLTYKQIGNIFQVSYNTIGDIIRGRNWKDVI